MKKENEGDNSPIHKPSLPIPTLPSFSYMYFAWALTLSLPFFISSLPSLSLLPPFPLVSYVDISSPSQTPPRWWWTNKSLRAHTISVCTSTYEDISETSTWIGSPTLAMWREPLPTAWRSFYSEWTHLLPFCLLSTSTFPLTFSFSPFLSSHFLHSSLFSWSFSPFFTSDFLLSYPLSPSLPFPLPSSCGLRDPSWAEIRHFVMFLDIQLQSCEASVFCDETFVGDVMAGLKGFVVKFMIRMSRVRQWHASVYVPG